MLGRAGGHNKWLARIQEDPDSAIPSWLVLVRRNNQNKETKKKGKNEAKKEERTKLNKADLEGVKPS